MNRQRGKLTGVCALVLLVGASACNDINVGSETRSTPTDPSNQRNKIEYRVNGNATSVRIRYSNSVDGLTQIVTTMPFITTITTNEDDLFLSLEATPNSYSQLTTFPFLSVQIFVNGRLFREASSNEFLLNTISVQGTWRRE